MRRLIDADKLKGAINASLNTGRETFPAEIMYEAVDAQPTAYDVDKVVAELEKESKSSCGMYKANCPYFRSKTIFCEQCAILRAIQIVKGGGIDGD